MAEQLPPWAAFQAPLTSLPPLPAKAIRSVPCVDAPVATGALAEREDGRELFEMRRIFMKTGIAQRVEGSCYLSQGKTRLLCSVFGPKSNRSRGGVSTGRGPSGEQEGELIVEVTFAPFCQQRLGRVTRTGGGSGQASRNLQDLNNDEISRLSSCIVQTFQSVVLLDRFPNASVEICLLVIQIDGSLFSAAINCVSLALADGQIPMKDICTSASVCVFDVRSTSPVKKVNHIVPIETVEGSRFRKIADQNQSYNEDDNNLFLQDSALSESYQQPILLVDPTLDELLHGPLNLRRIIESEEVNHGTIPIERYCGLVHLGLCPTDMSVAFLDAAGLPLEPPVDSQALQLAESACCAAAGAFKEQLRSRYLEKLEKEAVESQLSLELLDIVDSIRRENAEQPE